MKMDKSLTKEIKKRLENLVDSNINPTPRVDFGLYTIHAIDFLSRSVQDIANHGLMPKVTLLQEIDTDCTNFYKYVQSHITQTNSSSDECREIDLPISKRNTTQ